MKKHSIALAVLAMTSGAAIASSAHQHGVAQLNVAVDGTQVLVELHSPADNLVGFEHAPKNDEQRNKIKAAQHELEHSLFSFDAAAGCKLLEHSQEWGALSLADEHAHDDHHDEHKHDDHAHDDHHDEHKHDEHAHDDHNDEHKHDEHAHDDHHDEHKHDDHDHDHDSSHADVEVTYLYKCQQAPKQLSAEELFEHFPSMERVDLQLLGSQAQNQASLSAQQTEVKL